MNLYQYASIVMTAPHIFVERFINERLCIDYAWMFLIFATCLCRSRSRKVAANIREQIDLDVPVEDTFAPFAIFYFLSDIVSASTP
jgi:hypothetical protein